METQIKLSKSTSLVEQVGNIMLNSLKKSKPGDRILPERALAKKYNVSRRTIAEAIKHLTSQKLLERKVGKGTYVSEKINIDAMSPCSLINFVQSLQAHSSMEEMMNKVNSKSRVISSTYFHGTYSMLNSFLDLIKIRIQEQKATDIVYANEGLIPAMVEEGLIIPVDDLLAKSKVLHINKFDPYLLEAYTYKGKLYGIPQVYSTTALFYNKDLFDSFHIPYPDSSWTWDDLSKAASKLTSHKNKKFKTIGLGFNPSNVNNFMPFFYQNCPSGKESEMFLLPEIEESARFLYDMVYKYKSCLLHTGGAFGPCVSFIDFFQKGHLGMLLGKSDFYFKLKNNPNFNWGICELPQKMQRATSVPCQGWSIATASTSKQKSFKAIERLMSQDVTDIYCKDYLRFPAYNAKKELYPAAFTDALKYAVPAKRAFPPNIDARNILLNELKLLFNGHATPEEFYRNISECLK
jgi:multiple sugar transport system substrate-binding protein